MNVAHTPGPWAVSFEKRGFLGEPESAMRLFHTIEACHQPAGVNGRSLVLAEMRVGDEAFGFGEGSICHRVGDWEAQANARLMASAPELLAALERLVKMYGNVSPNGTGGMYALVQDARAAIAKARAE